MIREVWAIIYFLATGRCYFCTRHTPINYRCRCGAWRTP